MLKLIERLRVRDTILVLLTVGSVGIAAADKSYREFFANLAQNALTGYFALTVPNNKRNEEEGEG